jgi:hypothetical protein
MANSLFKTKQSGSSYVYVHVDLGSDITGDGSMEKPYGSYAKAKSVFANRTVLFRGTLVENLIVIGVLQGDEKWQNFVSTNPSYISGYEVRNLRTESVIGGALNSITGGLSGTAGVTQYSIINKMDRYQQCIHCIIIDDVDGRARCTNCITIRRANISVTDDGSYYWSNCVFPSNQKFYYNKALIQNLNFGNDPIENVRILKRAINPDWIEFGENITIDNELGTINVGGQKIETCRIVKEQKDGGTLPNIFNEYESDGITPKDFYLNPDKDNVALYASSSGNYVGALPAAHSKDVVHSVINVNAETGADSGEGVLLLVDSSENITNNSDRSTYNGQTWNRMRSDVIRIDEQFEGVNNYAFSSGITSSFYCGKKQTLFGSDILPISGLFTLQPNKKYKVLDSSPIGTLLENTGVLITKSGKIDVSVSRGFTLDTPADITGYSYQAKNENVWLVEVLYGPFESIEVIPYDDETTPSAFPSFSSPVNSGCLILYHKTGARAGQPVLFSEIANNKHTYFQNFAVSNADFEYVALVADTANYEAKKPILTFFSIELNAVYDKNLILYT